MFKTNSRLLQSQYKNNQKFINHIDENLFIGKAAVYIDYANLIGGQERIHCFRIIRAKYSYHRFKEM